MVDWGRCEKATIPTYIRQSSAEQRRAEQRAEAESSSVTGREETANGEGEEDK